MTAVPPPVPADETVRKRVVADRLATIMVGGTLLLFVTVIGLVVYLIIDISGTQAASQGNTITACNLANANRTEDVQIFTAILALPAIAKPQFITPAAAGEQAKAIALVHAKIATAYALRNCTKLYATGK